MTTITLRAQGNASLDVAWERYAQPALWATWSPPISRVDADAERIAAGVRGTVHGHLGVRVTFVVLAVDEAAHTWSWRVHVGPFGLALRHAVRERGRAAGGGVATELVIDGPAPLVLGYAPAARLALGRLVRA